MRQEKTVRYERPATPLLSRTQWRNEGRAAAASGAVASYFFMLVISRLSRNLMDYPERP